MKIDINKISGKSSGKKITLSDKIFSIKPNEHAIYLDVKSYLANQRQGNSKVKGRSEITGSTRKIKNKKVLEQQGLVASNHLFSREEVKFLDLSLENIKIKLIRKLRI